MQLRSLLVVLALSGLLAVPAQAQLDKARVAGIPASNKNAALEIPPDQEISSKTRMVPLIAQTKGTEVKWVIWNTNEDALVTSLALEASKTLLVFPNDQDDLIVVIAYTQVDGKLSDPVRSLIKVTSPRPPPKPKPDPVPGPGPAPNPVNKVKLPLHVNFILDYDKQTPEIASIITDVQLRKAILDAGFKLHLLSVKSKSVVEGGLSAGVEKAGGAPCLVLQDADGNIVNQARLTDAAAAAKLIQQTLGGN